ncbi:MAG: hypothetical protein AAB511_04425 [Patescibacteria group bacterium]
MKNEGFQGDYIGIDGTGEGKGEIKQFSDAERPNQEALEAQETRYILEAMDKVQKELAQIEKGEWIVSEPGEGLLAKTINMADRAVAKMRGKKDGPNDAFKLTNAIHTVRRQLEIDHGIKNYRNADGEVVSAAKELETTYSDKKIMRLLHAFDSISIPTIKDAAMAEFERLSAIEREQQPKAA